jgi:hypothetical protein
MLFGVKLSKFHKYIPQALIARTYHPPFSNFPKLLVFWEKIIHAQLLNVAKQHVCITGARGTDLSHPFFLTFCLQIYFQ